MDRTSWGTPKSYATLWEFFPPVPSELTSVPAYKMLLELLFFKTLSAKVYAIWHVEVFTQYLGHYLFMVYYFCLFF